MQASALQDEGLSGIGQQTLVNACRFYAPNVIPLVEQKNKFQKQWFWNAKVDIVNNVPCRSLDRG
jgi:hypothetical protein